MTALPPFSLVIPAFNEAERIGESLRKALTYLQANSPESELIVVNDGSTDATPEVVRGILAEAGPIETKLLEHSPNRGKGAAVREGLLGATRPIGLFSDADLSTTIEETPKLIMPIAAGELDVAFGSRALDRGLIGQRQTGGENRAAESSNDVRAATVCRFGSRNAGSRRFAWMYSGLFWNALKAATVRLRCRAPLPGLPAHLRMREIPVR